MDPLTCCLAGLCCPPGSPEQREAFDAMLVEHFKGDKEKAKKVADKQFPAWVKMTTKLAADVKKAEKNS